MNCAASATHAERRNVARRASRLDGTISHGRTTRGKTARYRIEPQSGGIIFFRFLIGLIIAALWIVFIFTVWSFLAHGMIFGYAIGAGHPLWVTLLVMALIFWLILLPFKAVMWSMRCRIRLAMVRADTTMAAPSPENCGRLEFLFFSFILPHFSSRRSTRRGNMSLRTSRRFGKRTRLMRTARHTRKSRHAPGFFYASRNIIKPTESAFSNVSCKRDIDRERRVS